MGIGIDMKEPESKQPEIDQVETNKLKIEYLEGKIKVMETSIRILDILAQRFAQLNGIKVERFGDTVIITQLWEN